jgi:exonuclease SbcC
MQPRKLEMTAFGPFPATEIIDFTQLGPNPLFLINGPTGSGKTTILDAICFALYGKTTGNERDGAQMRCDLAAADCLCELIFTFSLGERNFEIRRVPEQQRPKARGEGFTEQKPEAQLIELLSDNSSKLLVANKVSEATRAIEELTGLTVEQFRQVMVLPQGQFRQLLLAESGEREKILSRLFQTHLYQRLEERLKGLAKVVRDEREALLLRQQGILEGAGVETYEQVGKELIELKPQVLVAQRVKQQTDINWSQAELELKQALRLRDDFAQLETLQQQLESLHKRQLLIADDRQRLQRARLAQEIEKYYLKYNSQRQEQEKLKQRCALLTEQQGPLTQHLEEMTLQAEQLPALQQTLEDKREQLRILAHYRQSYLQLEQQLELQKQAQQRVQAVKVASDLLCCQEFLRSIEIFEAKTAQLKTLQEQLKQSEVNGQALKADLLRLEKQVAQTELAWHLGQAAIIAAELQDQQPCPVCGSLDHPNKAYSATELPNYQLLESLRQQGQRMRQELDAARDNYLVLKHQKQELETELERLHIDQENTDSAAQRAQIQQLERELQHCGEPKLVDSANADDLNLLLAQRKENLASLSGAIKQAMNAIPDPYRKPQVLEDEEKKLTDDIEKIEGQIQIILRQKQQAENELRASQEHLKRLTDDLADLSERLLLSETSWLDTLKQSDFVSQQQFLDALLPTDELRTLETRLREYDSRVEQLNGALTQQQDRLKDAIVPDLEQLKNRVEHATQEKNAAENTWQHLSNRQQVLMQTQKKLETTAAQLTELDSRYAIVGTLSDVANGQTGHKISLQRFVLSVLLEDVLLEANRRLTLMSKGRYHLLRKEERAKGNKASGLELLVEDGYSGKLRPVATLSGGESFLAALSLALGLSEVVQGYAGGIRLEALFIDEGFGSLDSEALELAIRALSDLRSSGRMIGVISHVAELKEQIPLRIDVASSRLGSSTTIIS